LNELYFAKNYIYIEVIRFVSEWSMDGV